MCRVHRCLKGTRPSLPALLISITLTTAFAFSSVSSAKLRASRSVTRTSPAAKAALHNRARLPQVLNSAMPDAEAAAANVTTDKTDYQPGETVVITGSGWLAGESVLIKLTQEPNVHGETTLTAEADEYGNIVNKEYSTTKEDLGTSYTVTATGQSSGSTATVNFTDGGQFSYSPNTTTLTIQTGPAAASDQFTQNITAPGGNGSFQASPQVVSVPATTPIPGSWLSFNPSSRNFATGPAQNPSADTRGWIVTATVPANTTPGTYVADIQAKPNLASVNVGVGQGTRLTLVVLPPAPVDNTPPSSSLSAQDSNGNAYNGVNFTNANKVTITLSATDPGTPSSGVSQIIYKIDNAASKTYNGPFDVAAEGISVITYFATDNAGNQETPSHSFTVKIDKTPPVVTAVRDTAANANGWNNAAVQVSYTATDNLSGINLGTSDPTPHTLTAEGANQSHTFTVYDNAGNSATGTVSGINIDLTAPSVSAQRDTPANAQGWNNVDVQVSYTASDALSDIDTAMSDATPYTLTSEGNNLSHTFTVYDKAGNSAQGTVSGIKIDKTAPVISSSRAPNANAQGWNNTDVVASYNASDALSGLDGSSPSTDSFTFSAEAANQSHTFAVTDLAGNQASSTVSDVNIDKTKPSITASRTPAPNSFGWNNVDVTASYTAGDALSGLDASSPATGSHLFNTEGVNQSHTFTVTDKAGNSESASISNVNIDKTAPAITITTPAQNGSYVLNSVVAANFSTSDALSGLDMSTQTSTVPQGNNIDTASVGSKAFTISVTDKAGNPASKTNNYNVTYSPAGGACGGAGHIILQPINGDGSSVFKKGSTVPAKFRVYDANCNSIGTAGVVTGFVLMYVGSSSSSPVNEAVDSTTPDTVFRWSPSDQQWIFNINTKNLSAGQKYFYRVTFNDNSYIDFAFSLK
jgi:hypothetical protein